MFLFFLFFPDLAGVKSEYEKDVDSVLESVIKEYLR